MQSQVQNPDSGLSNVCAMLGRDPDCFESTDNEDHRHDVSEIDPRYEQSVLRYVEGSYMLPKPCHK